jgi:hypothetical protein
MGPGRPARPFFLFGGRATGRFFRPAWFFREFLAGDVDGRLKKTGKSIFLA